MKRLLIHAWTVHNFEGQLFLPYTHWVYLDEISQYYDRICLLSPIKVFFKKHDGEMVRIDKLENIEIYELPFSDGYIDSLKYFIHYFKAYSKFKNYHSSYVRYPIPFGWLQRVFLSKKNRIIHFVGDPFDTFKNNPNLGRVKRYLYTIFFLPEYWMYLWACKGAKVFTNGYHIAEHLKKKGVFAESLVSSTLIESDFYFDELKIIDAKRPKILYVGYLRKAKGVETLIRAFSLVQAKYPIAQLTIVGTGESEHEIFSLVEAFKLKNVNFTGHVDNRDQLNSIIRNHDVFCFASLSEGSPRVILEAMANGLNVVSTPVGSLPHVFKDGIDILFADYHNENEFFDRINKLIEDKEKAYLLRKNAYSMMKSFTIQKFLKIIFDEN